MRPRHTRPDTGTKYVVDGITYRGYMGVFREAVARGFNGCHATVFARLKAGASTFAEVAKPVPEYRRKTGKIAQTAKQREMQDAIAALDARKRAMGLIP